jgi:hypothetical protein
MKLPRIYKAALPKFEKYNGKPKLSYSQITSFKDPLYKAQYILGYFYGIQDPGNIYAFFGGEVGEYIETNGEVVGGMLDEGTREILDSLERPEGSEHEVEIVVDRGDYVIQGFIDRMYPVEGGVEVLDFKTGNIDSKPAYYGSQDYQQTTLYSYAVEQEGFPVKKSFVKLLGRKGNNVRGNMLRLSGAIKDIPTPYSPERAEIFLAKTDSVAKEISRLYELYLYLNS